MKQKKHPQGFTLIELLVVITIIAVLASVAVPVYSVIQARAARTKALAHSKQIHLALAEFAIDEDGIFPTADNDSNSAFRQLFDRKGGNANRGNFLTVLFSHPNPLVRFRIEQFLGVHVV